jgi:hypothetical protein
MSQQLTKPCTLNSVLFKPNCHEITQEEREPTKAEAFAAKFNNSRFGKIKMIRGKCSERLE